MSRDPFTVATVIDARAGIVEYAPKRTKVAIIGAGASRASAPWDDPDWIVWGLNEIPQPRATAWWEMHPMSVQNARELAWLSQCPTPCYVLNLADAALGIVVDGRVGQSPLPRQFAGVANAVQYPLDRILALPGARDWFTSTFSYQVALAILDGFEEIGLWGVDLRRGTLREQTVEWAGLAWWLGFAAGRGIRVTVPDDYTWTHPGRYGFDYWQEKDSVDAQMDAIRGMVREGG